MEDLERDQWQRDVSTLAAIGAEFFSANTRVTVRISLFLAEKAVTAWERDDGGPPDLDDESLAERTARRRAGSLALIGLAISESGQRFEDHIELELDSWLVGNALDTADDLGCLEPGE